MARVLVLGNGLAGTTAALCAHEAGHEVSVVARSYGRTALSSGALFLGNPHHASSERPGLKQAIHHSAMASTHHPYAALADAAADLSQGYAAVTSVLDGFWPSSLNLEGMPFRTVADNGSRPLVYVKPSSMGAEALLAENAQLVCPRQLPTFRGKNLQRQDRPSPDLLAVDCAFIKRAYVEKPAHLARLLDQDENLEALADAIRQSEHYREEATLFLPPILGLEKIDLAFKLSQILEQPVYELAASLDSVLGLRLQKALERGLEQREIPLRRGDVRQIHTKGGLIKSVALHGPDGQSLLPVDSLILASGKTLGGGIQVTGSRFRESLLNLPLFVQDQRVTDVYPGRLTHKDFRHSQLLNTLGLRIDNACRVRNERNETVYSNLFACGHLLGGFDPFTSGEADGVDLATAARAAKLGSHSSRPNSTQEKAS